MPHFVVYLCVFSTVVDFGIALNIIFTFAKEVVFAGFCLFVCLSVC